MYSKEEARLLRKAFWEAFANYTKFYSIKIGEPVSWMLYKTGIKGLELKFEVEKKEVRVILEVNARSEDRRFDIFVELDKYRNVINEGFGSHLYWEEEVVLLENKKVAQIYTELLGVTYHNKDKWPQIFEFMASNMFQLQSNFELIHDVLKEKFKPGL